MARLNLNGLNLTREKLAAARAADPMPLLKQWEAIVVEGNRRGVLSGRDGYDNPMPPLKYRTGKGKRTANRKVPEYGTTFHRPALGMGANLTTADYQMQTGPRLAPRRERSRVIANFHTEVTQPRPGRWQVTGAWFDVVSREGRPFLPFHFAGTRTLPRYDLRPIRRRDLQFCFNALRAWARHAWIERF